MEFPKVPYEVTADDLTSLKQRIGAPHVVILGAGASLAAFPEGDANGRRLPLMANIVEVLGLGKLLRNAGHDPAENFESLYSRLFALDPKAPLIRRIEEEVEQYFSGLSLPEVATLYDWLILSLRGKDAIFTFNWDPFLADAFGRNFERNYERVSLPHIFHLHGNVRAAFCETCGVSFVRSGPCPECGQSGIASRLLYPVEQKNYADDPFIASQWQCFRKYLDRAWLVTVFGYRAPKTDREAMDIFRQAWKGDGPEKPIERLEIIDIRDHEELAAQWADLSHFSHYEIRSSVQNSWLARYPRRTCEALFHASVDGDFVEPTRCDNGFDEMQQHAERLATYEAVQPKAD